MGAGSLPGRNSLTLIVKGGGRESDRRRGGERRQARGFHDARFGTTCTCLSLHACVCCLEYVVIHMGVVSEAGVILLFFTRVLAAWASVCVCVGQVGGRVWCSCIIIHPPFPLLLEPVWGPCGGEMARERRAREGLGGGWSGGETSAEWMALFAWPCLCCGPLSFSCSLARTQHTASVLSAPLSPWPYSNKCLHCCRSAVLFLLLSPVLYITCSSTAFTGCAFQHSTDLQGKSANICLLRLLNYSPCTGVW